MLVFVIVAVFVAGLMVGRTPEYLGKKIEAYEMKMASLLILIMPLTVLGLTALAVVTDGGQSSGRSTRARMGSARFCMPLPRRATTTAAPLPGWAPTRLSTTLTGGMAMLIGRFWLAVPTLALAGSLVRKKKVPAGAGTLPTTYAAVRRLADRRRHPGRRAELRPGPGAWARLSNT